MLNWKSFPFFRWLIPLALGILAALIFEYNSPIILITLAIIGLIAISLDQIRGNIRLPPIIVALYLVCIFLVAYQQTIYNIDLNNPDHFKHHLTGNDSFFGVVSNMPVKKGDRVKILLNTLGIKSSSEPSINCSGNILLYLPLDEKSDSLKYGDLIYVSVNPQEIKPPQNPHAFDYKRYLHFQNIHYQGFVKDELWQNSGENRGSSILKTAFHFRAKFIEILRKYLPDENNFSVGSALILGYKNELKEEVRAAYAHTGAMHVLAVSGLHVGFIFLILNTLLKIVTINKTWWKITRAAILIIAVWSYALLTGASPSVLRASTMFSFLIIGLALNQPHDIYNSLAASAFVLLIYDPKLIMNVGFQLSYMAVIGIVFFQPLFAKLWLIENKIGNYLWQLVCVSFAAQLTTLPLGFFYFHQFPIYFWLSGLIVVPAAMFILGGGIALFIFEMILPFLGSPIGQALNFLIECVNWCIFSISKIPGSLLQGIWIGMTTVFLLYFSIGSFARAVNTRRMKWILVSTGFILIVSINFAFTQFHNLQNQKIIVYNIYKNSMIDFVDGRKAYSLQNIELPPKSSGFAAQNNRWSIGVKEIKTLHFSDSIAFRSNTLLHRNDYYLSHGISFLQFFDTKIAVISDKPDLKNFAEKLEIDMLIVCNNPYLKIAELQSIFDFGKIIFDGSNAKWKSKKWQIECDELGIEYWNVQQKGAFVFDLE